tara:strand:+ start:96 stop:821 length:726 start_codon:yes stop_codon:yes gene_type:complete
MSKIPINVITDFTLNEDIFKKYIPDNLRKKVYEIQKYVLQKSFNHYPATRYTTEIFQPKDVIKDIPKDLLKIRDIYEINFIGIQYLLNLIEKYNYNPNQINILVCGCGTCIVDYYLNRLGYNITSHDNWSQLQKNTALDILSELDNKLDFHNTIKIQDNINELENKNFDFILDTGNYLTNQNIIKNKNLKILFTWAINRLDKSGAWGGQSNDNNENITYLQNNFKFIDLPSCKIFIRKDLI